MPDNKNQHYVPKMYLKRFANKDNFFYLFRTSDQTSLGYVPYSNHCQKDYFYGEDKRLETIYKEKELKWNECLDSILNNNYSDDVLDGIKEFAIYQHFRTYNMLTTVNEGIKKSTNSMSDYFIEKLKINDENAINIVKNTVENESNKIIDSNYMFKQANNDLKYISDMKVLHVKYNTNHKLVSSDCPILMLNPYIENSIGLANIGLIMMFPISSDSLIVIYDGKIYDKYSNTKYIEISNQSEVNCINELMYINSDKLIYSKYPFPKNLVNNNIYQKKLKYEKVTVQPFSNNSDQLIAFQFNGLTINHTFSFAKISKKYGCIDKKYREPIARTYSKKYEDKLINSYSLYPDAIFSDVKRFRKGEKEAFIENKMKYHKLIKEYWS